jgi:hypothetical protein
VGHLGGGDQAAGLNHLVESGQLASGDYVLVLGNGLGSNWTCAVIQAVADMDNVEHAIRHGASVSEIEQARANATVGRRNKRSRSGDIGSTRPPTAAPGRRHRRS